MHVGSEDVFGEAGPDHRHSPETYNHRSVSQLVKIEELENIQTSGDKGAQVEA